MEQIVVFATAWGSRRGGVNAFNADLCAGLRRAVSESVRVTCVIVSPAAGDLRDINAWRIEMEQQGVRLVTLRTPADRHLPTDDDFDDLKRRDVAGSLYIGHDLFTGPWAVGMGRSLDVPSVVINHMAPDFYQPYKVPPEKIEEANTDQAELFEQANFVAAVGPRLLGHARTKVALEAGARTFEIIPGLAEIESVDRPMFAFGGITIGRIAADDDIVKQGRLAAQAFGQALSELAVQLDEIELTFHAYGLSRDATAYEAERHAIHREIVDRCRRAVAVQGHRFSERRDRVFAALRRSDVFYMLSLHEGFGLSAFEAIAAGVPVVLTVKSGLYDFLNRSGLSDYVAGVSLRGEEDRQADISQVALKTVEIFRDKPQRLARAYELRAKLRDMDVSWRRCAEQLLAGTQCGHLLKKEYLSPVPQIASARQWPWSGLYPHEEAAARSVLAWLLQKQAPLCELEGQLDDRKRRVVARICDIVRWDLSDLYRLRVERLEQLPAAVATERLLGLTGSPSRIPNPEGFLLIVDLPTDDAEDPAFWSTLLARVLDDKWSVLLTTKSRSAHFTSTLSRCDVAWTARLNPRQAVSEDDTLLEAEAARLLANSVFGLDDQELLSLLPGSSDSRYAFLNRLETGDVRGFVRMEQRWLLIDSAGQASAEVSAKIGAFMRPRLDRAVALVRRGEWVQLRQQLLAALECLAHLARSGDPQTAFSIFSENFHDTTLYRFARFDCVISLLRVFFPSGNFDGTSVLEKKLAAEARRQAALALTNTGRLGDALKIYHAMRESQDAVEWSSQLHVNEAMSRYLIGDYDGAEEQLRYVTNANDRHSAVAWRSLGKIAVRRLRLDEAKACLLRAASAYRTIGDSQGLAGVYAYLAEVALAGDDSESASANALFGLGLLDDLANQRATRSDARDRVRLLLVQGKALQLSRNERAASAADDALAVATHTGAFDFIVEAHTLAVAARAGSSTIAARSGTLEGLAAKAKSLGLARHYGDSLLALGSARAMSGDMNAATETLRGAVAVAQSIDGGRGDPWLLRSCARLLEHFELGS